MNLTHLGGASLWLSWNCGKMPIWHVLWFWGNSLVTKHHLWRHESGRCNAATEKVDGKQSKIGIQTTITQRRNFSAANLHSCDTTFSNRKSLTWIDQNGSLAPTSTYTLNEHFTLQRFNHLGSTFGGLGGLALAAHRRGRSAGQPGNRPVKSAGQPAGRPGPVDRAGQPGCPVTGRNQPGTALLVHSPFTHWLIRSVIHSFVQSFISVLFIASFMSFTRSLISLNSFQFGSIYFHCIPFHSDSFHVTVSFHSFARWNISFFRSFISFIHSFIHPSIHASIHPFDRSIDQPTNQPSKQSINQSRIHSLVLSCVNSFSSLLPLAFMSFICNLTSHVLTTSILLHFKDIPIGHWFLMVIAPPKLPPLHGRALLVCMSTWSLSGSMFNPRIWIIDFIRSIPKRIRWIRCSQTVPVWFIIPDQYGKLKKSFR